MSKDRGQFLSRRGLVHEKAQNTAGRRTRDCPRGLFGPSTTNHHPFTSTPCLGLLRTVSGEPFFTGGTLRISTESISLSRTVNTGQTALVGVKPQT